MPTKTGVIQIMFTLFHNTKNPQVNLMFFLGRHPLSGSKVKQA